MITIPQLYQIYTQHPKIVTDSRKIEKGSIFFALKGANFNGNNFALQALEQGAAYSIVDEPLNTNDQRVLQTENVLQALQQLALHHRKTLDIPIIAITGTNGKTTTKELIYAVLSTQYNTAATEGNLNNHIGVPLTLLKINKNHEIAIVEMGANHRYEIESYCQYTLPNFGIINNCGKAHLEGFGSEEGVRLAKGELYQFIKVDKGTIFINNDLDYLIKMSEGIENRITYGTTNAQIIGKNISTTPLLEMAILSSGLETSIATQLTGSYNLPNALVAVAVGNYFKIGIDKIKSALENYTPQNNRSQLTQKGTNQIILDAYNANPTSMQLAINNIAGINTANKWLILGSMKELGKDTEIEHRNLVKHIQEKGFENVILTGIEFADCEKGNYLWFENTEDIKPYLIAHPINNALILIKGSRGNAMEKVLEML